MPFRVHARTIFHLGADLISSDAIALYELVKNAFDAGSRDVEIACVVRVPSARYFDHHRRLSEDVSQPLKKSDSVAALTTWKDRIAGSIDTAAPDAGTLRAEIAETESLADLLLLLEDANYVEVTDTGSGMTLADLESIYLSIGTPHRLNQKREGTLKGERRPLGDKGVGRLAAMRLGQRLLVETTTTDETRWNLLEIDWRAFLDDLDADIGDIPVTPRSGLKKDDKSSRGTRIRVSSLTSVWTPAVARDIADESLAKLGDPFGKSRFPIVLLFNGDPVAIPRFESVLTEYSHAQVSARLVAAGPDAVFEGTISYSQLKRKRAFSVRGANLLSICDLESFDALDSLGSFDVRFYWFNRQAMRRLEGGAELKHAIGLQERWAGGLMVYRDGFRVNPYGTGDDDWLILDRAALASSGYKVNRRQIVGKVSISSETNPKLEDQTNREGIRDSVERGVLVGLLKHLLLSEFKPFLDECDSDAKIGTRLTVAEIEERVAVERKRLKQVVRDIKKDYPKLAKETDVISTLEDAVARLEALMEQARLQVESYEEGKDRVVHLAATGLLVEMLAHELNRATRHALAALKDSRAHVVSDDLGATLRTLEAQLRTLQKRLRLIDPLGTAGRQVKETFDLIAWVGEIVQSHAEQFRRHGIEFALRALPPSRTECSVTMVKGMLVQVLENLLSNSIYWLDQQRKLEPKFRPSLTVTVDTRALLVSVNDNGPGIEAARRQSVFEPFVSTKPAKEGKGLGLFISREIARYHKASLDLADPPRSDGTYATFVLDLGSVAT